MEEQKIYNEDGTAIEVETISVSELKTSDASEIKLKPEDIARQYTDGFPEDADFNPYSLEEAYIAGYMAVTYIPDEDEELYERVRTLAESYKLKFINEVCGGYLYPFCVSEEDVVIAHMTGQRRAERDTEREKKLKENS